MPRVRSYWAEYLRELGRDIQRGQVGPEDFADRVWKAFSMFVLKYGHKLDHKHLDKLRQLWESRPKLGCVATEIEWLAGFADKKTAPFFFSSALWRAIDLYKAKGRTKV